MGTARGTGLDSDVARRRWRKYSSAKNMAKVQITRMTVIGIASSFGEGPMPATETSFTTLYKSKGDAKNSALEVDFIKCFFSVRYGTDLKIIRRWRYRWAWIYSSICA
jgi:hypothetical protein